MIFSLYQKFQFISVKIHTIYSDMDNYQGTIYSGVLGTKKVSYF